MRRAPTGGTHVDGQHYDGGQFLPDADFVARRKAVARAVEGYDKATRKDGVVLLKGDRVTLNGMEWTIQSMWPGEGEYAGRTMVRAHTDGGEHWATLPAQCFDPVSANKD